MSDFLASTGSVWTAQTTTSLAQVTEGQTWTDRCLSMVPGPKALKMLDTMTRLLLTGGGEPAAAPRCAHSPPSVTRPCWGQELQAPPMLPSPLRENSRFLRGLLRALSPPLGPPRERQLSKGERAQGRPVRQSPWALTTTSTPILGVEALRSWFPWGSGRGRLLRPQCRVQILAGPSRARDSGGVLGPGCLLDRGIQGPCKCLVDSRGQQAAATSTVMTQ